MQELINILGACERIRNTPIPFNYALHIKRVVLLFSMMLPFAFLDNTDEDIKAIYIVVPIVMLVFYTMVGLELIAEEIEDPFGYDDDDLLWMSFAQRLRPTLKRLFRTHNARFVSILYFFIFYNSLINNVLPAVVIFFIK